jgi:hypothetical protein
VERYGPYINNFQTAKPNNDEDETDSDVTSKQDCFETSCTSELIRRSALTVTMNCTYLLEALMRARALLTVPNEGSKMIDGSKPIGESANDTQI